MGVMAEKHSEAALSTEGSLATESESATKLLTQERLEGVALHL